MSGKLQMIEGASIIVFCLATLFLGFMKRNTRSVSVYAFLVFAFFAFFESALVSLTL